MPPPRADRRDYSSLARRAKPIASRRTYTPPPKPPPPAPVHVDLHSTSLHEAFVPEQQQAKRAVVRAQAKQAPISHPHIPRLPNPTPHQTHVALQLVAHSQRQALGPNPSTARIRQYQSEVANDPRLREFRDTAAHYARAAEGHLNAIAGAPRSLGSDSSASKADIRNRGILNIPGTAAITNYLGARVAEDVPQLAAVASGAGKLLTQPTPTGHSILGNAVSDIANIGRVPLIGAYQFGGAGVQAAQGDLKPAKELASGIAQGVEKGAVGQLVQGNLHGALRALQEHPVLSPLEVAGGLGAAGRAAGAMARFAGVGGVEGALGRAVSRVREPIALGQDIGHIKRGHIETRTGSPDLIRALAQQALDRRRGYVLDEKGRKISRAEHGVKVAAVKPREGRWFNERERLENRRGNFYSSSEASAVRQARELVPRELAKELPKLKGRVARSLIAPAAAGTFKTAKSFEDDLRGRIEQIEGKLAEGGYRHEADQAAAEANLKTLKAAEADPKVLAQKEQIIKAGEIYAKLARKGDDELERLGVYPAARLERGRLSEYALANIPGAKHETMIEPEALALHKASVAAHRGAQGGVGAAEVALRKAEDRRTGYVAQKRSAQMRGDQPGARPATAAEKAKLAGHDKNVAAAKQKLKEAREHEQEVGEALLPKPKPEPHIRDAQGNYLSNETIRLHAKAAGRHPDTLAYVPHRLDERISSAYFKQLKETRLSGGGQERTGHLYEGGSNAMSLALAREELVNKATTITAVKAFDRLAGDAGLRHPEYRELRQRVKEGDETLTKGERNIVANGGYMKWAEATELADRLQREGKGNMMAFRAHPAGLDRAATGEVRRAQGTAQMESAHQRLFNDRVTDNGSTANNVVLVPKTLIDRIKAQNTPVHEFEKWGRLLNVAFRYTVLPQFKWLAGNFIEPYFIRLPLSGSGFNLAGLYLDLRAAKQVIKHMEASPSRELKDGAANIRATQLDPGLFVGGKAGSVHTSRTDFEGAIGRMMASAANLGAKEFKTGFPVLHQLGQMALALPKFFFHFNRHFIENPAQRAAFGKSVRRDLQKMTGQWHKTALLGHQAVEEASRGLVNTATQHRFLKEQHELLGQYDSFGPSTRRFIQSYTPFLPWTLASLRFVYWTLPIHHTVAFNALMKAGENVLPEWEATHAGTPGDLQYSPQSRGGFVDVPRLTPFGVSVPLSAEGPGVITDTFAPQIKGAQEALKGNDPFGKQLSNEPLSGKQKTGIAAYSLLEGFIPGLATARRLQEGGGTSAAGSTVWDPKAKPGTAHISALERTLSPLRPIYLKAPGGSPSDLRKAARETRSSGAGRAEARKLRQAARRARAAR